MPQLRPTAAAAAAAAKPTGGLVRRSLTASVPESSHLQQEGLPKLPVPPLRQTCQTYLECLKPLVSTEELGHTQLLVDEFLTGGVGDRLQKGLERRARKTDNWVQTQGQVSPHSPIENDWSHQRIHIYLKDDQEVAL